MSPTTKRSNASYLRFGEPMLFFINFKAYKESTGQNAINLVRNIEENFGDTSSIRLVINPLDSMIPTRIAKFIQNAHSVSGGPYTGHIPIESLRWYGYSGVMLNHSEYKVGFEELKDAVGFSKDNALETLICASDIEELKKIVSLDPDYIAYEPPELIGGDVSVSSKKPEIIQEAAGILDDTSIKLIVGAGIKNRKDVEISEDLGAHGVLVSSGVVKSMNPIRSLQEMMKKGD